MRETILKELAKKNTLLAPGAWEYLGTVEDPVSIVRNMVKNSPELPFPVGRDCLVPFVESVPDSYNNNVESKEPVSEIKVNLDITGNSTCTGELSDFTNYFLDRYQKLKSILSRRREAKGISNIRSIKKRKGEGRIIAMIGDISNSSNGNITLTLEDPTGIVRGFIKSDSNAFDKGILEDEIVIAVGKVWEKKNGYDTTFAIDDIIRPSVPRGVNKRKKNVRGKIAFIGDIHIGSKTFLKENWERFLLWMESDDGAAAEINYLIIVGDLIDGIGIYPNQEAELEIKDIYEQYRILGNMLKRIPERVKIIAIPGNHDIVRNMEPQPSLPKDVQTLFPDNVMFFGNPSLISIGDLEILLYHGGSINDLSDLLPSVNTDYPCSAMKEMLERRHLVPVYGKKTPIAPEEEDMLVIRNVPDIFVTGH
ncbi:MAG: metallophosphoesterase, partial [Thermoplasmata archaeon]